MKNFFLSALLISTIFFPAASQAQQGENQKPGLSPLTRKYLKEYSQAKQDSLFSREYIYKKSGQGRLYLSALIKISDAETAAAGLESIGAHTGTKAGNIWTVKVPVEMFAAFTELPGIRYIQIDEPASPAMNVAITSTRTDSVHRGIDLPMPYSGKNVVVGVIDFGFDYGHPTFFDTLGNNYRVKRVWELNTSGTPPAGYNYGHELKSSDEILTQGTDNPKQIHGTGVAGISSGSGFGSPDNRFRGIAYEADMVFVGVRRDSIAGQWMQGGFSDFVDGIAYIFDYAASVNKPAVVNISWGSQSGPHDGSSLFNEACNELSGPGRIIVMSAGNDGQDNIHLSKTYTDTDTLLSTFLVFSSSQYKRTWIDIWGEAGKDFCAQVTLYNGGTRGESTGFVCLDELLREGYLLAENGTDTCYVDFIASEAEYNGRPRITVSIYSKAADNIEMAVKAKSGTIHLWNEYYYYGYTHGYKSTFQSQGYSWARNGNNISTTSDMGSAESVLLVGAYSSKTNYTDINGRSWSYNGYATPGRISPFSSRGPLIDGRIKPDIAAPGLTLATAVSSFDTTYTPDGSNSSKVVSLYTDPSAGKKYYYGEFIGTSASAPAASGIVALLLEANPGLSPADIKEILFATAIRDQYMGNIPAEGNNIWGQGKINAYGAIRMAIQKAGTYSFSGKNPDCVLYPNPNKGSFTIENNGDAEKELRISIYSTNGLLIKEISWQAPEGQSAYKLDLPPGITKGIYIVRISSGEGSTSIKTIVY
jgi:minor extracellular serine protease Vpr